MGCIYPLCGCAGRVDCKEDPLNMPLPGAITIGHATFGKGVKLRLLVEAAERWQRIAYPPLSDEEKAANLARLQGTCGVAQGSQASDGTSNGGTNG